MPNPINEDAFPMLPDTITIGPFSFPKSSVFKVDFEVESPKLEIIPVGIREGHRIFDRSTKRTSYATFHLKTDDGEEVTIKGPIGSHTRVSRL